MRNIHVKIGVDNKAAERTKPKALSTRLSSLSLTNIVRVNHSQYLFNLTGECKGQDRG